MKFSCPRELFKSAIWWCCELKRNGHDGLCVQLAKGEEMMACSRVSSLLISLSLSVISTADERLSAPVSGYPLLLERFVCRLSLRRVSSR